MKKLLVTSLTLGGLVLAGNVMAFDTTSPTGTYYGYADFGASEGFLGGQSVGGDGNNLFVMRNNKIDMYTVGVSDLSKVDQHPDNPDATGPVVSRTLTYNKSIDVQHAWNSSSEIAVWGGEVHYSDSSGKIRSYNIASGIESASITTTAQKALLAYDAVNDVLYGARDSSARTVSRLEADGSWTDVFTYSSLAGSHMDGLEMVYAPDGTGYMYVSDMTSNYLGQLKLNSDGSFTETNLFSYNSTGGDVEGLGFGPLGHFWATDWDSVYEVGGGDLGGFTPPADVPEPATMLLFGAGLAGLVGLRKRRGAKK